MQLPLGILQPCTFFGCMYVIQSEETDAYTYTPRSQSMRHIVSLEMGHMIVMYKLKSYLLSAGEGKGKEILLNFIDLILYSI